MKKMLLAVFIVLITVSCTKKEPLSENAYEEVRSLYKEDKYEDALSLLNRVIEEQGEDYKKVNLKFILLTELERYEEALEAAIKKEKLSERKSPWRSMDIAYGYLKLNNDEEAIKWFGDAVDRGFQSINIMEEEPYDKLTKMDAYPELLEKIKERIGIDRPAKDFTVTNLSGNPFTLSEMKGKVVMIDFWATWCGPCRKEIPNLVEIYSEHGGDEFEIIGVSLDEKDDLETLQKFIDEYEMEWQVSYSGQAWYDETAKLYNVSSIPSVWLVDKKGNLRYFDLHGDQLKEKISELVSEKI